MTLCFKYQFYQQVSFIIFSWASDIATLGTRQSRTRLLFSLGHVSNVFLWKT